MYISGGSGKPTCLGGPMPWGRRGSWRGTGPQPQRQAPARRPSKEVAAESGFLGTNGHGAGQGTEGSPALSIIRPLTAVLGGCCNICMKIASLIIHPDGGSSRIAPTREAAVPPLGHMAPLALHPALGNEPLFTGGFPELRTVSCSWQVIKTSSGGGHALHVWFVHTSGRCSKAPSR